MEQRTIKVAAGAMGGALLLLAGVPYLKPLALLPTAMQSMVATTHDILGETRELQVGVGRVQANLGRLEEQEALLDEQGKQMAALQEQLSQQEQLAGQARELLLGLLKTEQTTAALTAEAAQKAGVIQGTLSASRGQLGHLSAGAASIQEGSDTVNSQMDTLLANMGETKQEFAPVGRLKRASSDVLARSGNWLKSVVSYFYD